MDELRQLLISKANMELEFNRDLTDVTNNPDISNLNRSDEKYGSYDEIEEDALARPHLLVCAIVCELRRRLA